MRELWRTVERDPRYEVSNFGRVRSYCRSATPFMRKLTPTGDGHLMILLKRGTAPSLVHVLVAEAFLGPKPEKCEVRHLNGDGTDNRDVNLQWATRRRNSQDKKWHKGQSNYKLTGDQAREIKRRLQSRNGAALAREFGVSKDTISDIRRGKTHADA